ncbi:CPBP family intramembrane glutamic endopeptidase [Dokdonia ponticola]|uniref:CPBP family intramembrane glutamic endopeptidase n=1 Tax=Dokdonia ponticola TaxID=2041041 RepID=A0ABV9HXF9_9FLAO
MDTSVILTYGSLWVAVMSIWLPNKVFNKIPLWVLFLVVSFVFAFVYDRASIVSFVYTGIFGCIVYRYYQKKQLFLFFLVLLLSIPLLFHFSVMGFDNYRYLDTITLSENSTPYSLYFNLDKTAVGIFIIGFSFQSLKVDVLAMLKQVVITFLIMALLFFVLATVLGYSKFEPKLPHFTPVWIVVNLFFTCLAEEAIFRRLIQQRIFDSLSKSHAKYAFGLSLIVASLAFGLAHFNGGVMYIGLASVAGLFYGYVYYRTKRIESAMFLHVLFNLTHLLLFTYPSLAS